MRKNEIERILETMFQSHDNVSDLIFTVGRPLQVESAGQLVPVSMNPPIKELTPFQTEVFALNLLGGDQRLTHRLLKKRYCDFSYHLPGKARFRVNVFSQRGSYSIVMRKLETKIPTIKDLGLPDVFRKIAQEKNGLILITGATGVGKSTSMAALLNDMNESKSINIITLEDPVEFLHTHKMATFNQREFVTDFDSFADGLRAALRQAPKVIFVGELRDKETMEIGITAAETGHLVLSTLHTIDAGQTINRIMGMFDQEEQKQVRLRLADTMRWIVSQRLLPKVTGGRVAVFEILGANVRVKETIADGETEGKTFYDIIGSGEAYGMQTFDKDILKQFEAGMITEETALSYASKKAVVGRGTDVIKFARGEKTTDIDGLNIDEDYNLKQEYLKNSKR